MRNKDNCGPAFPKQAVYNHVGLVDEGNDGISMRDYFAAKAMQAMICAPNESDHNEHPVSLLSDGLSFSGGWRGRISVAAYAMADAMLEARK